MKACAFAGLGCLGARRHARQRGRARDDTHAMPAAQEFGNQRLADIAGTARDQHVARTAHATTLCIRYLTMPSG